GLPHRGRHGRAREPERSFPWLRGGRGGRMLARALVDPPAEERDLRRREGVLVLGHLWSDASKDALHDQSLRALAGPDRGAIAAAIGCAAVGRQREAALALLRAMAFETLGFEKRADLALEIDPRRSGARLR